MSIGIYSALSAMKLKEEELDVTAHNIANANTPGFKENLLSFEALLSKYQSGSGETPFAGVGEKVVNFEQGSLLSTHNPLDIGLQGKGLLEVQTDSGSFYTRSGSLALDSGGYLVTTSGGRVMGTGGAIHLDQQGQVSISPAGNISVNGQEQGKLRIVGFAKGDLEPVGASLFRAKAGSQPQEDKETTVLQGSLESSNTNVMKNLIKLMEVSRDYQAYQKVMSAQSKVDEVGASSIGKIS
jgi:flagellar basal-body rod protein FlgF